MSQRYVAHANIVHEMKTHVQVTAAALILIGLATGCQRTTEGTVAMTTEPGPPLTAADGHDAVVTRPIPGLPNIPIPDIRIPGLPEHRRSGCAGATERARR